MKKQCFPFGLIPMNLHNLKVFISDLQGSLFELPAYHPMTDTLCYPLLFPRGDDGFYNNMPFIRNNTNDADDGLDTEDDAENEPSRNKKFITLRNYIRYRLAIRQSDSPHNIWSAGGGLS